MSKDWVNDLPLNKASKTFYGDYETAASVDSGKEMSNFGNAIEDALAPVFLEWIERGYPELELEHLAQTRLSYLGMRIRTWRRIKATLKEGEE